MASTGSSPSKQTPAGGSPAAGRRSGLPLPLLLTVVGLAGIPAVAYVWETVNQLLGLHFDWPRLALSLPVAAFLALLLRAAGRAFTRLAGSETIPPSHRRPP